MTRKFEIGDRVRKISGSSWHGHVCGFYSTDLTPYGYCVESEREIGSVQIYPERTLEAVSTKEHSLGRQLAEARAALKTLRPLAERYRTAWDIAEDRLADLRAQYEANKQSDREYRDKLVSQLAEAAAQIRYLHAKFSETGSGNAVLARIDAALQDRARQRERRDAQ